MPHIQFVNEQTYHKHQILYILRSTLRPSLPIALIAVASKLYPTNTGSAASFQSAKNQKGTYLCQSISNMYRHVLGKNTYKLQNVTVM
jgi:hypothetical protein